MRDAFPEFAKRSAELIVIGNGPSWMIDGFKKEMGFEGRLFVDPSLKSYQALDFKRSALSIAHPKAAVAAARAVADGHFQSKTAGDPLQIGGAVVVAKGGEIIFRHASAYAGDHVAADALLAALDRRPVS